MNITNASYGIDYGDLMSVNTTYILKNDVTSESISGTTNSGNVSLAHGSYPSQAVDTLTDSNGNPFLKVSPTASAVDSVTVTNAATGSPATVSVAATGSDANININLVSKGSGAVQCNGAACGTGGMVYPGAGIPQSTGSAWGTSLTAPGSALMGISDTQTVTNKDLSSSTNIFAGMSARIVSSGTTDSITSSDAGHFLIYDDGANNVTVTVADAGGTGLNHYPTIAVSNKGTGTLTLNRTTTSTINGSTTATIYPQSSCTLHSPDNANWLLRCVPLLDSSGNEVLAGNLVVNGQLQVAGPWLISTLPAGSAMTAAGSGLSSMGISNDGNFYISANAGTPSQICTLATGCGGSGAVTSVFGRTGVVAAVSGDYTAAQVTGAVPNTTTVNGHALSSNVVVSASDLTTGTLPHAQLPTLLVGDLPAALGTQPLRTM